MSKAVILKTNEGVLLVGAWQCSNGTYFDAEGCFNYCNSAESELANKHQSIKLTSLATRLGFRPKEKDDWYKHRENFIDIDIPYDEVEQDYSWEGMIDETS